MGVQGQGIVFYQAVPACGKPGAPIHSYRQRLWLSVPLMNKGISEFMPLDLGSDRIKAIGLLNGKG